MVISVTPAWDLGPCIFPKIRHVFSVLLA